MAVSGLRAKANKALLAGKLDKALELFAQLHETTPDDLRVRLKLAELREKTGDTAGAVQEYIRIARKYADEGLAVQAIAIDKIIMRLDPSQTEIKEQLKKLSVERGDDWALSSVSPPAEDAASIAPDDEQVKNGFARTPLLSGLSGEELEEFIDSLELRSFAKGDFVFQKGDSGDYLFLIGMGEIQLETKGMLGKTKVYMHLGEGDFFGVHAFMSRSVHNHMARAATDAAILMIDRATFDAWVEKYPGIQSTAEEFYRQHVLAQVLVITPVFEGIPDDVRLELSHRFKLRTFGDDETIVTEGEGGDTFFLIRSGAVQVSTVNMNSGQQKILLGTMVAGNFFGEVALLTGKPRTATVTAQGAVELMELSRSDFNEIAAKYPSIRTVVEAYQKKRVQSTIKTLLSRN